MSKTSKKYIVVYTDGSCAGNGKTGAVGGIGIHFPNGELKDISKIFKNGCCTNQRAELYAILTALRYIKQNLGLSQNKVCIKTDSQYSIDCVTKWVYGWIKNGWMTKNNTPVANKEFIELIHKYYENYDIVFDHIEAHTGLDDKESVANAIADKLATMATKKAQKEFNDQYDQYGQFDQYDQYNQNDQPKKNNHNYNRQTYYKQKIKTKQGYPNDANIIVELIKNPK